MEPCILQVNVFFFGAFTIVLFGEFGESRAMALGVFLIISLSSCYLFAEMFEVYISTDQRTGNQKALNL